MPTGAGDWLYLTDLEGDGDERLAGPDTEIGAVLADAARRGAVLRGLLWRSHPIGHSAGQLGNLRLSRTVNDAGGEFVLDHRVRRGGSHHQKIVVIQRASRPPPTTTSRSSVASTSRTAATTAPRHQGDPQPADLGDDRYGERPPWHDIQLRLTGPAVADVAYTFRERWEDPNPLDTPSPWRVLRHRLGHKPPERGSLAPPDRVAGSAWQPRGPGAAHVSGPAQAVPVRPRRASAASPARTSRRSRTHAR